MTRSEPPQAPVPERVVPPPAATFQSRLAQVARSDATVLIEGEHGSGKNRAAEALHRASPRAQGPLVTLSLAALAPTLLEAELFGHEVGAFTGATSARLGRFRQAAGGTLVLDDVDALPLELQGKLLRVLQERVVEPLGSESSFPIDVRVVCTTSVDLREAASAGRFRADLYWRIAVVPLVVPPLRTRKQELPELVRELARRAARAHGLAERELSAAALERLAQHSWPGNVRELENAIERVLVLTPSSSAPIEAQDFHFLDATDRGAADDLAERALARGITLEDFERSLLQRALAQHGDNVSAAARHVGLTRRAFEYRLARFENGGDVEGAA